ncbi:MAG: hypothetical protein K6A89_12075 [Treponema sp.]|nr:hypothetical protein [Treponema sp.]
MNYYTYLDQMQSLCLRASRALKVIKPEDPVLVDVYSAAEHGFFEKKQNCFAANASVPAGSVKVERLKQFQGTVEKWEEEAAYLKK